MITEVDGIRVGHWTDLDGLTGCTVVLCPPGTVGSCEVRGGAPGTRETDALRPGTLVNEVFWGLWLLPFGWLVVYSRFLPRWLGYWLLLDGVCWVVTGVCGFLAPGYTDVLFRAFQPAFLAELAALLWLLIVGAKDMTRSESAVATT